MSSGLERIQELEAGLHQLYRRKDMSGAQRGVLLDSLNRIAWDDAIHIAAPWEPRSSLCGLWYRNLVEVSDERPNGMAGCWTCLMAAEWLDGACPDGTKDAPSELAPPPTAPAGSGRKAGT